MQLYCDPISTACRPLLALIAQHDLQVEIKPISLMAGEHLTDDFARINPRKVVPVLVEGDFVLTESGAILRYLAERAGSALYPTEPQSRARVNEALDFLATAFAPTYCKAVYLRLVARHNHPEPAVQAAMIAQADEQGAVHLQHLETEVLAHRPFLTGQGATIADFVGVSNVTLAELIGYDFSPYPNVRRWVSAIKAIPAWHNANKPFEAARASMASQPA